MSSESQDASEVARTEIEHGVHKLETLLETTVDRTFDKFELYTLRHLLSIEPGLEDWIRLAHYEVRGLTQSGVHDSRLHRIWTSLSRPTRPHRPRSRR